MVKRWHSPPNFNLLPPLNYDSYQIHRRWMQYALELASIAGDQGEVPVGAVIVNPQGHLIATARNQKTKDLDPTAHAEILAIRSATKAIKNCYLQDCTLYVTLEPCPMCAGAIVHSRLGLLVYGTDDPKTGAIQTVMNLPDSYCSNHSLKVLPGIEEKHCRQQLKNWFRQRRNNQH